MCLSCRRTLKGLRECRPSRRSTAASLFDSFPSCQRTESIFSGENARPFGAARSFAASFFLPILAHHEHAAEREFLCRIAIYLGQTQGRIGEVQRVVGAMNEIVGAVESLAVKLIRDHCDRVRFFVRDEVSSFLNVTRAYNTIRFTMKRSACDYLCSLVHTGRGIQTPRRPRQLFPRLRM